MWQDDRCGICGNHYQSCKHYLKAHLLSTYNTITLCGKVKDRSAYIVFSEGTDPDDLCRTCLKSFRKFGQKHLKWFAKESKNWR
jgi:hypothetical protein